MVDRRAGQYARQMTRQKSLRWFALLVAALLVGLVVGVRAGFTSAAFIGAELILIALGLVLERTLLPRIDRWDRGASGEEHVGAILDGLASRGWRVMHDVDTGRGNIDHLIVGPGGVFTIETKSHGGRIDVDRLDERMLRQAYAQSKWVEEAVGVRATPLLVFSRAYLSQATVRRRGVVVLPARMLTGHLTRRRTLLSPADVERLACSCGSRT
jgi:hypothetical protein